jgi:RNA-directed DNA polymerase
LGVTKISWEHPCEGLEPSQGSDFEIACDAVLDQAYAWLCARRRDYSAHDDVWTVRRRWPRLKPQLQAELRAGTYRFSPVRRYRTPEGGRDVWAALDALVLKALAIVLARRLAPYLSPRCTHLAGHGGSKAAVRAVAENLAANTFVLRTDVKSYYASIDHDLLLDQLRPLIPDGRALALITQYLRHVIYDDGLYRDVRHGLSRGCPLSPLLGALYLQALDRRLERLGLFYVRFMDDWVAMAPTRWKLRKAIQLVNQTLNELKLGKHPDKTFIGRIERGFDFLGYHFSPGGLSLAPQTTERFKVRLARLYERGADVVALDQYARRWWHWANAGVTLTDPAGLPRGTDAPAVLTTEYLPDHTPHALSGRVGGAGPHPLEAAPGDQDGQPDPERGEAG